MAPKYGARIDSMIQLMLAASVSEDKQEVVQVAPISPGEHALSRAPNEIWWKVLDHVDLQDVMSLRLAGGTWAAAAHCYLFKTFVMRPDRDDFENFEFIVRSSILNSVRGIRLELGTLNVNHATENLAFAYLEDHNELRAVKPDGVSNFDFIASFEGKSTAELDRKKQTALEEYAAWNVKWHAAQQDFRTADRLRELFEKVVTLDRVEMAYKACPFRSELLMNAWIQDTGNYTFNQRVKECSAVLTALKLAKSKVKHFSHDGLPWTFFILEQPELLELVKPLENVESIRLTISATSTPHSKFCIGLAAVLKSMPELQEIHIGFAPFQCGSVDRGTWQDSINAAEWYVPLQKMFGGHAWKDLRKLRVEGLVLCEVGLTDFLDHHPRLQVLELHDIALWQGTFQSMLTSIAAMKLVKFRMWGVFSAFHSPEESWRFTPGYDTSAEFWSPVFKKFMHQRAAQDKALWLSDSNITPDHVRLSLESFVLQPKHWYGLDSWPLSPGTGIKADGMQHLGRERIHNRFCSKVRHNNWPGCLSLSSAEIDEAWESLIDAVPRRSGDSGNLDLHGVGEMEFATFYTPPALARPYMPLDNDIPVNIFGFDCDGNLGHYFEKGPRGYRSKREQSLPRLVDEKVSFRDLQDEWCNRPGHISAMDAYHMVLNEVLSLIPRYEARSKETGIAKDQLGQTPQVYRGRERAFIMGESGRSGRRALSYLSAI